MTEKARPFRLVTVLGAPASGKTTLVEELLARYRVTCPGNEVAIIDPNHAFPGDEDATWPADGDVERWLAEFKARRAKQRPTPAGFLLLDDADRYLMGGPPKGIFRDLFSSFRHWRLDVTVNARRTQDIPKMVIQSADTTYIFRHREVHGRKYLADQLGEGILERIPRKPYEYLRVDVDSGEIYPGRTRPRATPTVSDRELSEA